MVGEQRPFQVSAYYCIYLAVMLLVLPVRWLLSLWIAAAFHELCHWLAIRLLGTGGTSLRMGVGGARLRLPEMGLGQELISALAGPAGSIALLSFLGIWPQLALCGFIQGIVNLLPIYPLDGGRALRCILRISFSPPVAKKLIRFSDNVAKLMLIALGFGATVVLKLGLLPMILSILILLKGNREKLLANRTDSGYNNTMS